MPTGWEFIILIVLAYFLLGPDRLPEYAAKLARFVVHARRMANDAKGQLKEQMGPEFDDLNWRQYDPRQYDPRRIVRDALLEPLDSPTPAGRTQEAPTGEGGSAAASQQAQSTDAGGTRSTPFDDDAT